MKILFINPNQFGYTAGYYFYCRYLVANGHTITFYCFDQGFEKQKIIGVDLIYIKLKSNKLNTRFSFYSKLNKLNMSEFDIVFLNHHRFSFLCRFFGVPYNSILDIRTGDIRAKGLKKLIFDKLYKFDTYFYKHITILSESLRRTLRIRVSKCTILPLGSIDFSIKPKEYNSSIKMLYIGTFNNRNISDTIEGVYLFTKDNPTISIKYDIVGFGFDHEENKLIETIAKYKLNKIIKFHGRKNYSELTKYFDNSNVGVSYVPITKTFDVQPPTKTYEYILSGLFCIATATSENKKIITKKNGFLISDTSRAFANAIFHFHQTRLSYDYHDIKNSLIDNHWKKIVLRILEPLFFNLIKHPSK